MNCPNCGHSEEDHVGYWTDGELIPGNLCYHMENQGYQQDLCPCPGFEVKSDNETYLDTLLQKAGVK